MKEVLVVYYSQSGQLKDILKNIATTIEADDIRITYHKITPKEDYPFPWKKKTFFDSFPESFLQIPCELEAPSEALLEKKFDLILLGHQVWFLSPSIPLNSFLKSEYGKRLLANTPVVTVIAARNMWIMAQEKVKKLLVSANAHYVGNIALVDRHINHISVITIVHWMFTGRKDRLFGIFPKPGVSEKDITEASRFGTPIQKALQSGTFSGLQNELLALNAVDVNPFLVTADKRGNVLFSKWANHIRKKGNPGDLKREKWLVFFNYYLLFAIWVIAPIVFIVFLVTYIPMKSKINRDKKYYSSVATKKD